jgi:RNA polymerase sigma-70 factor (ECF subfamily)
LKVLRAPRHLAQVKIGVDTASAMLDIAQRAPISPTFTEIYEAHFDEVVRWMRALGAPEADWQDLSQDVFCIVRRKLASRRGDNLVAWLYGITRRVVKDHRRLSWFRHLYLRPRDVALDGLATTAPTAEEQLAAQEEERVLFQLLDRMSTKRRSAFILFEIEGYTAEQIGALEGIPTSTVYTRLYHARKDYFALCDAYQRRGEA